MRDLISREDAIELAKNVNGNMTWADRDLLIKQLKSIPSAGRPKPTGDLISREDAIKALNKEFHCTDKSDDWDGLETAIKIINALPSAEAVHIEVYRELYEKYVELKHASAEAEDRQYIKIYADDEPSVKAEKLYQICDETQNREVAEWLKEYFPSINDNWIPCSARLPNEVDLYLVSLGDEVVETMGWNGEEFVKRGAKWPFDSITAWQPRPTPYREERDYELATEQMEHDAMYEPTYNSEDGSM